MDSNSDHIQIFGAVIGHLEAEIEFFEFSQEIVKICVAARNLDTRVNFDRSDQYNQPVQYGRDAAHKSRVALYKAASISSAPLHPRIFFRFISALLHLITIP